MTSGWFEQIEIASILAVWGLAAVGLASLLTVPILKGGLTFKLLGLAVVHRNGVPASRLRCLARAVVTWFLPFIGLAVILDRLSVRLTPEWAARHISTAVVFIILTAAIWAVFHPSHSLQDRIARTRVVPH
jgi:hypothetical protein